MLALKYSISVFFSPSVVLVIYLFYAGEMGVVFEQFDEKASVDVDAQGAGGTRLLRTPPPRSR